MCCNYKIKEGKRQREKLQRFGILKNDCCDFLFSKCSIMKCSKDLLFQIIHHMRVAYDNDVRFMYKTRCCKKKKKQLRIAKVFVNMEYQGKYTLLCVFYPAGWWPWKQASIKECVTTHLTNGILCIYGASNLVFCIKIRTSYCKIQVLKKLVTSFFS